MDWHFSITAASAPRLLMRVAMVFDQQLLTLTSLDWRCDHTVCATAIQVHVCCQEHLARRIHAKLLHLQDITQVDLVAATAAAHPKC